MLSINKIQFCIAAQYLDYLKVLRGIVQHNLKFRPLKHNAFYWFRGQRAHLYSN